MSPKDLDFMEAKRGAARVRSISDTARCQRARFLAGARQRPRTASRAGRRPTQT